MSPLFSPILPNMFSRWTWGLCRHGMSLVWVLVNNVERLKINQYIMCECVFNLPNIAWEVLLYAHLGSGSCPLDTSHQWWQLRDQSMRRWRLPSHQSIGATYAVRGPRLQLRALVSRCQRGPLLLHRLQSYSLGLRQWLWWFGLEVLGLKPIP